MTTTAPTRKPTRIERLAPDITTLAASIGQEVRYHGGEYFLLPCQRSLWNTRDFGPLTQDGADTACRALAAMVDRVRPMQERPLAERIDKVAKALNGASWRPGHFVEVTTEAQDRGTLSQWCGAWTARIAIVGGPDVEERDHRGSRPEAVEAARCKAIAGLDRSSRER